jgi:hypothetical protein
VHSLFALPEAERGRALAHVRRQTIDEIEKRSGSHGSRRHLVEIDEAIRSAIGGPAAFLRALPRGYHAVTRHAGILRTQLSRETASIQVCLPSCEDRTRLEDGALRYVVRLEA